MAGSVVVAECVVGTERVAVELKCEIVLIWGLF